MARNSFLCADVLIRNYSLTHLSSFTAVPSDCEGHGGMVLKRMCRGGVEGELANPCLPGRMAIKLTCVCV